MEATNLKNLLAFLLLLETKWDESETHCLETSRCLYQAKRKWSYGDFLFFFLPKTLSYLLAIGASEHTCLLHWKFCVKKAVITTVPSGNVKTFRIMIQLQMLVQCQLKGVGDGDPHFLIITHRENYYTSWKKMKITVSEKTRHQDLRDSATQYRYVFTEH